MHKGLIDSPALIRSVHLRQRGLECLVMEVCAIVLCYAMLTVFQLFDCFLFLLHEV